MKGVHSEIHDGSWEQLQYKNKWKNACGQWRCDLRGACSLYISEANVKERGEGKWKKMCLETTREPHTKKK